MTLILFCYFEELHFTSQHKWTLSVCHHEQLPSTARNLKRKDSHLWSLELHRRQQTGDCLSAETTMFVWVSLSERYLSCSRVYQLWTRVCTFIPWKSLWGLCQSPSTSFPVSLFPVKQLEIKHLKATTGLLDLWFDGAWCVFIITNWIAAGYRNNTYRNSWFKCHSPLKAFVSELLFMSLLYPLRASGKRISSKSMSAKGNENRKWAI